MQNSIEIRGNSCTEFGSPVSQYTYRRCLNSLMIQCAASTWSTQSEFFFYFKGAVSRNSAKLGNYKMPVK